MTTTATSTSSAATITLTPFQRHLKHFALESDPNRITFLSAIRGSFRLGLDFPVALILSIGLRILYSESIFSAVDIPSIPRHLQRTQLDSPSLSSSFNDRQKSYSLTDLLGLYRPSPHIGFISSILDKAHILSFWSISAQKDLGVTASDLKRFKEGGWEADVVKRRKGREDVLPFWRGGPIIVGAHSWFVRTVFGVRVYER